MKKIALFLGLVFLTMEVIAQEQETFTEEGWTLLFINEDPNFDPDVKENLVQTFFEVYPQLVADFNPESVKQLEVKIDTAYKGVAYAHNGKITISSEWLRNRPEDIDLLTHEVMHIVQSYPHNSGPGWLTEGIADFVRYKYGLDNPKAGWSLPEYAVENSYRNSYRITARFLLWITERYNEDLVLILDENLRNKTYSQEIWKEHTGKALDELWEEYSQDPKISDKI